MTIYYPPNWFVFLLKRVHHHAPRWQHVLWMTTLWLSLTQPSLARSWQGLNISVNSDWAGCTDGGYLPIRIKVLNRGNPRTLRFVFSSDIYSRMSVERTIQAGSSPVRFSLLIPCAGMTGYGSLQVYVDGSRVRDLEESIAFPSGYGYGDLGPGTLLISPAGTDWSNFYAGLDLFVWGPPEPEESSSSLSAYRGSHDENHMEIEPAELPEEWQAYTGLDLVLVSLQQWPQLPQTVQKGLVKWVETGGTILIYPEDAQQKQYDPIQSASDARTLNNLLGLSSAGESWRNGRPAIQRKCMLGKIYLTKDNPLTSYSDMEWKDFFMQSSDHLLWTKRHGFSATEPTSHFLNFLIPSVKAVPVIAFLVLISFFVIMIGPVNYFTLWIKKRLYLLIITIPLIAMITSLSLLGYSVIAHGFSTRARLRSLTLLDQTTNRSVTMSRIALYSGLAPSDGLKYSQDSAVFPIWAPDTELGAARVDWTNLQHFSSGWLRSRTRTQFLVTQHNQNRGRLDITTSNGKVTVSNGLEWKLTMLLVKADDEQYYVASNLAAGDSAVLKPVTDDHIYQLGKLITDKALSPPKIAVGSDYTSPYATVTPAYGLMHSHRPINYSTNLAEKVFSKLSARRAPPPLPKRSYIAVLGETPDIDVGLDAFSAEASLHVLLGFY